MADPGDERAASPKTPGSSLKKSKDSSSPRFLPKKGSMSSPAKREKKDKEATSSQSSSWWSLPSLRRSLIVSIGTSSFGKGTIVANLPYETQNLLKAIVS